MQAIALQKVEKAYISAPPQLAERSLKIINHLRLVARRNRSAARMDLEQACALLLADPANSDMRHAETLMRGFKQAVSNRPVFYQPGTVELSFDEAWLGRLFETMENGDDDSFWFLIQSRVPRWTQRNLAYLVRSISKQFHQI
ncbi:hypothetical protein J7399_19350 [Shimia sp. R9_1]|uniref:hypothetical protein n=1 Tax=Shimia sp. R9_1 TaxID=2821111 RepID=UPI001ADA346F|nr:hypothetical protein [Shimia sp. R9_1]MBO9409602.1 hypothetical protein [Shimia sp. R9_1]